jgi:hypothetical protein
MENTSLIKEMGGVYTSGKMGESTTECLAKTGDMERYVLAFNDSFLVLQGKR